MKRYVMIGTETTPKTSITDPSRICFLRSERCESGNKGR